MAGSLLETPLSQSLVCLGGGGTSIKDKVTCFRGVVGVWRSREEEAGAARVLFPSGEGIRHMERRLQKVIS